MGGEIVQFRRRAARGADTVRPDRRHRYTGTAPRTFCQGNDGESDGYGRAHPPYDQGATAVGAGEKIQPGDLPETSGTTNWAISQPGSADRRCGRRRHVLGPDHGANLPRSRGGNTRPPEGRRVRPAVPDRRGRQTPPRSTGRGLPHGVSSKRRERRWRT